jgi:fumarate hydratase class II
MATPTSSQFRVERDSMGQMQVPADAYYGASTQRAVENFPISNLRFGRGFIRALGLIKKSAAVVNRELGLLDAKLADAIVQAAQEVVDGKLDGEFVVDIFQTGSGTSTNMNANEVIASRANEMLGGERGGRSPVHPNDHVNRGQSSNDVIPTAIHVAAVEAFQKDLVPALEKLQKALEQKAKQFDKVVKIGRTHLQDATPVRLGQEFGGYASQLAHAVGRARSATGNLAELAIGGTAVGTGLNTHPEFPKRIVAQLKKEAGLELKLAPNFFEALAARDAAVEASGALKTIAVSLTKVANDLRWLGSGPRCGLGEIALPATQPGSSIMPGKVNPVMCESVLQVAAQVIGNDAAVAFGGALGSNFELNVMKPVIAHNLLESATLLASVCRAFVDKCVNGLEANAGRATDLVEQSLAMCTALTPKIGYDAAAAIAKKAFETGRTVREVAREATDLSEEELTRILDPWSQTEPAA